MTKSYQDKYTRWHHKETVQGDYSSNNGWIYSAYSKYLAKNSTNHESLQICANKCVRNLEPIKIDRSPADPYPPFSKDEVIGMVSLGLLAPSDLEASHWNFCNLEYEPKKLTLSSIIKAIKAFRQINKEIKEQKLEGGDKRNYMWQNKRTDAYSLGFWLQPWDQYYCQKMVGKRPSIFQTIFFYINFIDVLTRGNKSVKMMLWLQLTDMNHFLLKYVPKNEYVRKYFDSQHPFVKGLK